MIIQRWQNLLLFVSALLMCVFFFTPFASVDAPEGLGDIAIYAYSFPVFLTLNLAIFIMMIIAIALFRNLKKQRLVTATTILLLIASVVCAVIMVNNTIPGAQLEWLGGISMPVISAVCCLVAYICMGKDQKKLRSYDRLR